MIEMISAISKNKAIGKDNSLLWNIPEDMKHFVKTTKGKTVVMGSNTFFSIGKPLKNRRNIVLSRDPSKFKEYDVEVISDYNEILSLNEDVIIIGGEKIYNLFLEHTDILHLTVVDKEYDGDTFFPDYEDLFSIVKDSGELTSSTEEQKYFIKAFKSDRSLDII